MRCPKCSHVWTVPKRSLNQNDYFHGVVLKTLSEALGYDIDEMKGIVKWQINEKYGMAVPHTSDLTSAEFEKFLELVREWASRDNNGKQSIYIPLPNEGC